MAEIDISEPEEVQKRRKVAIDALIELRKLLPPVDSSEFDKARKEGRP